MLHNKFTKNRQGKSTFTCIGCGKLTRDTGDNGKLELCPACLTDAYAVNEESDSKPAE